MAWSCSTAASIPPPTPAAPCGTDGNVQPGKIFTGTLSSASRGSHQQQVLKIDGDIGENRFIARRRFVTDGRFESKWHPCLRRLKQTETREKRIGPWAGGSLRQRRSGAPRGGFEQATDSGVGDAAEIERGRPGGGDHGT